MAFKVSYPSFRWYPCGYQADYSSCYQTWKSKGDITSSFHWYSFDYHAGYSSCYETWESRGGITCSYRDSCQASTSSGTAGTAWLLQGTTSVCYKQTIVITDTAGTNPSGTNQGAYPQDTGDTNTVTCTEAAARYLSFHYICYHAE